ncbi:MULTISPECIES: DUF350 domain-containing protein [Nocardiopsis]|jgi:uncharacterized membrane protein YjfL (UPF0719 family)|uniref:DUF350 domain-containing protein n=1 Tax=Nocardiopsis dassonvillei (strain ATCC 23218 / DSM 43111 / CIP 107115 / JCM 7437 / KCTC 9190 / NBRC 14626 / NCTC 10488 / NRRL B-5397 / IMRU 509) TaxID=446468 RepID=D7B8P7_NOCDD|nr:MULTISPECIES: DUF350 domain-containing protein [Nocardiopsis]ADH70555.1 protein of unknown function DUF350 [Nocardiopsis dassonvillei subsp. dassonvillei DSM 43111]APC33821.1 hypothetical protein A9R04_03475 [Nocardiopsis dassonvillei]NKY81321.1 DUF350 domain-containing protein [Nocardiopsis dassonvillei]VEI91464.1 Predicted membrane protein [Nocardiopsis dassonvillei]
MNEILLNALGALAYGGVGIVILVLGYLLTDLLTPGKLHVLIWENRNRNAVLLVSANTLGSAIVVTSAILSSESEIGLGAGLLSTAVYGLIGLGVMALSFVLIDLLVPAKIAQMISNDEPHPATWVSASAHVAIAVVIAAALT